MTLTDAGPLIAIIDADEPDHEACLDALDRVALPLVTTWPAFTEAMYLLGFSWQGQSALWEMLEMESIRLATLDHQDAQRMKALMHKYRDLPMDLADAGLVRVAEREKLSRIFTLDRRHFRVYRPAGVGRFMLLP